jgi:hypothetical protein
MIDTRKLGLWLALAGAAILVGGISYWSANQPVKVTANSSTNSNPWLAFAENGAAAMPASDENLIRRHKRSKANTWMIVGAVVGLAGTGLWFSSRKTEGADLTSAIHESDCGGPRTKPEDQS